MKKSFDYLLCILYFLNLYCLSLSKRCFTWAEDQMLMRVLEPGTKNQQTSLRTGPRICFQSQIIT